MEVPSCWSNGQRACPYLTIQLWIQLIMNEKRCRVLPIKKNKSNCGFNLSSHWRLLADAYEITRSCYFFNRNCFSKYFFLHQKLNELAGPIETLERRRRHLSLCVCDRPRWKLKKKNSDWLTNWCGSRNNYGRNQFEKSALPCRAVVVVWNSKNFNCFVITIIIKIVEITRAILK